MLRRDGYGRQWPIEVCCDYADCSAVFASDVCNMTDAKILAHKAGWLVVKRNGIFVQICPTHRNAQSTKGEK